MILAIGNSSCYEVDSVNSVKEFLEEKNEELIMFKQDRCLEGEYLSFECKNGCANFYLDIDGKKYNAQDFSAIWYIKPQLPKSLMLHPNLEYRQFIERQFRGMRSSLWSIFQSKRWLNDPWAIRKAENKIFQLSVAADLGFKLPDTEITSDPERIRSFYKKNEGKIIVKTLTVAPIIDHVIYTNRVTDKDMERIDDLKQSPAIFQAETEKEYELRITVVKDKIFATKIHSQDDKATSLDWRRKPKLNDFSVFMEPTKLPSHVEKKIHSLMERLGLQFGCIDMIVRPNGEHVFLEINSNGQWYFVQLDTGVQIAKAIAHVLAP